MQVVPAEKNSSEGWTRSPLSGGGGVKEVDLGPLVLLRSSRDDRTINATCPDTFTGPDDKRHVPGHLRGTCVYHLSLCVGH